MSVYYIRNLPAYTRLGFLSVRDSFDNLSNVLRVIEIVNASQSSISLERSDDFDLVIFTGICNRVVVRKSKGFFTMSIPFQVINSGEGIYFNCDYIGGKVDGLYLSVMRNAISVSKNKFITNDDIVLSISETFGLGVHESINYSNAFFSLLADDHGYFRFDDDFDNEDGDVHPRYHFDFFYKNSSCVKIGVVGDISIEYFYSLFDKSKPKKYMK
ncbi:MAG: hypothetical protein Q8L72_04540 [Moraxellaceae bacterium]|nr:hypothetical protein [Moraxellaceae bacterium]